MVGDRRILITTDRQSAFNYNLGLVPYKGAVLNQLSKFWFDKSQNIIPNHMIATPDPESGSHDDERLTRDEILDKQIIPTELYLQMERVALELFKLGSDVCLKNGLILLDTKYEFGIYEEK